LWNALCSPSHWTAVVHQQAILAALVARQKGAGGQHITTTMLDSFLQWLWPDCYYNHIWVEGADGSSPPPPPDKPCMDYEVEGQSKMENIQGTRSIRRTHRVLTVF